MRGTKASPHDWHVKCRKKAVQIEKQKLLREEREKHIYWKTRRERIKRINLHY